MTSCDRLLGVETWGSVELYFLVSCYLAVSHQFSFSKRNIHKMSYISQGPPHDLRFCVMGVRWLPDSSRLTSCGKVIAFLSLSFELLILTLFLIILHYFTICIKFVLSPYLNLVVLLSFSLRGEKGAPLPCCA